MNISTLVTGGALLGGGGMILYSLKKIPLTLWQKEALVRAGRIDVKIEVLKPSYVEISKYLSVFYNQEIEITGSFNMTMSDVQEICIRHKNCPNDAKEEIISKIING